MGRGRGAKRKLQTKRALRAGQPVANAATPRPRVASRRMRVVVTARRYEVAVRALANFDPETIATLPIRDTRVLKMQPLVRARREWAERVHGITHGRFVAGLALHARRFPEDLFAELCTLAWLLVGEREDASWCEDEPERIREHFANRELWDPIVVQAGRCLELMQGPWLVPDEGEAGP